jgi:two-component system chemotaxis response regulator CheB
MTDVSSTPVSDTTVTRLMIVDDSLYMRMAIRTMVAVHPDIVVVGEAADGDEAVALEAALSPDVITMDIAMPGTDGIEATRRIAARGGAPVIMLSNLTERGAEATFLALAAGAVDYIPKSASALDVDLGAVAADVTAKVRFWSHHRLPTPNGGRHEPVPLPLPSDRAPDLVLVVSGDGSSQAVRAVLSGIGTPPVPVVVVQEMPTAVTVPFIDFLRRTTGLTVREALPGAPFQPGEVTVLPGGKDIRLLRKATGHLSATIARPSGASVADQVMISAAGIADFPVAVILGGRTPCHHGAAAFKNKGFFVLIQDRGTCLATAAPDSAAVGGVFPAASPGPLAATLRALLISPSPSDRSER